MNLKKKLQVFISSTYTDMLEERQAAVMAILEAGHIPVGMELFTAGDKEVFEAIKKWIDQSDVFLLILGGRYGSIDKVEQKSYTHMEYDYATAQGKPFFSLVMTQSATQKKISKFDSDYTKVIETGDSASKYDAFKATVTEKMCKMCDDVKDIKNATLTSLRDFEERPQLVGWVSGKLIETLSILKAENHDLQSRLSINLEKLIELKDRQLIENEKKPNLWLELKEKTSYNKVKDGWFYLLPTIVNKGTSSASRAKVVCELNDSYRFRYHGYQFEQTHPGISVDEKGEKLIWELEPDKVIFNEDERKLLPWEITFIGDLAHPLELTVKLYADSMQTVTQAFTFPSPLVKDPEVLEYEYNKYIHFSKARQIVRAFHLKSREEWDKLVRGTLTGKPPLPVEIPIYPDQVYVEDWHTWSDWLGLNRDYGNDSEIIPEDKYSQKMVETVRQKGEISYGELTSIVCKEFNVPGNIPLERIMVLKYIGLIDYTPAENGNIGTGTKIKKTSYS